MNGRRKPMAVAALLVALVVLSGCRSAASVVPEDAAVLYEAVENAGVLPDMQKLPPEDVQDYVGIAPDTYTSACAATARDALLADAVMVFAAKDDDSAKTIEARLNDFLSYRRQEMRDYLPEQYAVLQRAVLRRDGLNVALLVTRDIEKLNLAYQAALHR